ncbi:sugar phosphate isomerase/epimerase [Xylophilus sp. GOD-11R]|uniref:sugar phosphate isomerase/epimerase family protein n=1 Tax=Xylophilus sp. GOD-11R TaxID=3089814 RepID=UPI00298BE2C8|nr:sugar phosphate isomerase/epimerase [Xylophilus sp. GOD-11R]WPB57326.1 sugar phosphate isomerase/epimerase [Xylophilus sp. GOD-11R]
MTTDRSISISAAPYDGYEAARMLESLARIGATHVEPAWIVGYTEPFDESAFTPDKATAYAGWMRDAGIACRAFSSHIDLGRADAVKVFKGRMDFARRLGAEVINTNASGRGNERRFLDNIAELARHAEAIGIAIGLENPGDGSDNLLDTAADGPALLGAIGERCVGLNYDAGNTASHRPDVPAADDALIAMPLCVHTHVKDVRRTEDGWFFTALGEGEVGVDRILTAIAAQPGLHLSIEIPMRLHRGRDAKPGRDPYRVPLADIERVLGASLRYARGFFETSYA